MADNSVFITGALPGALAEALDGLPPWATQNTAESIEHILKKTLNIQTAALSALVKGGSKTGPKGQTDLDSELNKLLKNLAKENQSFGPRRKFWKDDEENNNKRRKHWKEEEEHTAQMGRVLAGITAIGLKVKQTFEDNVNTFDALYQSGINVVAGFDTATSGFNALQQMATLTGVRYTELAATMTKYNAAVNAFGTQRFAKTLTDASRSLGSFGYTTKQTAELLGAYLETQRGFTDARSRTESQVQNDLVKFGKRITNVSLATGIARDKLLQHVEAISQSVEATILAGQAGATATDETLAFIGSFKDQNVGQAFLRMMTDSIKPLNDTFMSFQKTGFGGFGQELMNFTQSLIGLDATEAQKRVAQFAASNESEMDAMVKQANLLRQAGLKAESDDVLAKIAGIRQQARAYRDMTDAQRKTLSESAAASASLRNSWEKLLAQMQITFAPVSTILDIITFALTGINDMAGGARELVGNTAATWLGFGAAVVAVVSSMGLLVKGIKFLTSTLFASKAAATAADYGSAAGSRSGRGGRGGRSGPLDMAGQGIGAGIGNALGGLARGLSALGTPKVLLGVAALAGIGAALWVTGKAVQQFVGLSWEDLGKAGLAIVGLTAAAAAAGVGSKLIALGAAAFAALGASLWVVGKAIDSISSGITSIGSIFSTVGSGITVLTKALDGFTNLDKLKSIVSTINSIELLKAAAFGVLSSVNAVSLPAQTSSAGVSVPTTPKASTLISPSNTAKPDAAPQKASPVGVTSAPGIEKSAKATDINSAIAFQSAVLEQILASNNSLLSVNKDILRYTKSHL